MGRESAGHDIAEEKDAIFKRRGTYGIDPHDGVVGLALAGGGIRSATFSLGLLRGLSRLRLLQRVDYLSTVSGGGYAGAFYCGLFAPRAEGKAVIDVAERGNWPTADLLGGDMAAKAIRYLRQSGRYLTPAGARDYIYAAALLIRNWVAVALISGLAIFSVAVLGDGLRMLVSTGCPGMLAYLWASPILLAAVIPLLAAVGAAWGYWLTMRNVAHFLIHPPFLGTCIIGAASLKFGAPELRFFLGPVPAACSSPPDLQLCWRSASLGLFIVAATGLLTWGVVDIAGRLPVWFGRNPADEGTSAESARQDRARVRLTLWMAWCAEAALLVVGFAIVDTLGIVAPRVAGYSIAKFAAPGVVSAALVPLARKLVSRLASLATAGGGGKDGALNPGRFGGLAKLGLLFAWLAAAILAIAAVLTWAGLAHSITWPQLFATRSLPFETGSESVFSQPTAYYWWIFGTCALFLVLASFSDGFVNLSSLATFYAGRLRRAYLGAGNPARIAGGGAKVSKSLVGDDLDLGHYYRTTATGAPVHLINVTINETHSSGPATVQRDRHGRNLALSPGGMLYSQTSDGTLAAKALPPEAGTAVPSTASAAGRPGENLMLSAWVGISGAAFSTGLGSQTNLAFSMLAFFSNMRLGYWWRSDGSRRRLPSTYFNLKREATADFPGISGQEWYLTDGGHFENTAVYELVRRRIPFIIASDNGCDPRYGFADLANLVRKCRIDFGAQIELYDGAALDRLGLGCLRNLFASPAQFLPGDCTAPSAIAMLAKITYDGAGQGTLLIIKPRLTPDGPADLTRYLAENPAFPQQTTLDQFFDEAQWESYFELGRRIAERLFALDPAGSDGLKPSWKPSDMTAFRTT